MDGLSQSLKPILARGELAVRRIYIINNSHANTNKHGRHQATVVSYRC